MMKSDDEIANLFAPIVANNGVEETLDRVKQVVHMMKDRVNFVYELWPLCSFFFIAPTEYDAKTVKKRWKDYKVSFVFSTGTGTPQTVDFTDINKDTYLEVLNEKNNEGHYKIKDVTADMPSTGINSPVVDNTASKDNAWYTLSGMKMIEKPNQAGIYIHQGKKVIIK